MRTTRRRCLDGVPRFCQGVSRLTHTRMPTGLADLGSVLLIDVNYIYAVAGRKDRCEMPFDSDLSIGMSDLGGCHSTSYQSSLLKRQVQSSALEYIPAVKHARTKHYVQQQQAMQAHQQEPAAAAAAPAATQQQSHNNSPGSSNRELLEQEMPGSLTCEQLQNSPQRLAPYPARPTYSSSVRPEDGPDNGPDNAPDGSGSSYGDGDASVQPIVDLLNLVRHHKRAVEQAAPGPAAMEALLDSALTETGTALHITLNAMSLATSMCDNGCPEAADQALEFAERALSFTVTRLARAQTLVLQKVQAIEQEGIQLPEPAARLARNLAAAVGPHNMCGESRVEGGGDNEGGDTCSSAGR